MPFRLVLIPSVCLFGEMSEVLCLLFNQVGVFVVMESFVHMGVHSLFVPQCLHSLFGSSFPSPAPPQPECVLSVALLLGAHCQQHRGH